MHLSALLSVLAAFATISALPFSERSPLASSEVLPRRGDAVLKHIRNVELVDLTTPIGGGPIEETTPFNEEQYENGEAVYVLPSD